MMTRDRSVTIIHRAIPARRVTPLGSETNPYSPTNLGNSAMEMPGLYEYIANSNIETGSYIRTPSGNLWQVVEDENGAKEPVQKWHHTKCPEISSTGNTGSPKAASHFRYFCLLHARWISRNDSLSAIWNTYDKGAQAIYSL